MSPGSKARIIHSEFKNLIKEMDFDFFVLLRLFREKHRLWGNNKKEFFICIQVSCMSVTLHSVIFSLEIRHLQFKVVNFRHGLSTFQICEPYFQKVNMSHRLKSQRVRLEGPKSWTKKLDQNVKLDQSSKKLDQKSKKVRPIVKKS